MFSLGDCKAKTILKAPIESLNLGEWLFTLKTDEYAACSTAHQSAAQGHLPSDKRVSVNVEYVAGFFMVQHYIEDISERNRVLTVSPNSLFWLNDTDYAIARITWELNAHKIDDSSSELSCHVKAQASAIEFAKLGVGIARGISKAHPTLEDHTREEAPKFGKDIERKALAGVWR